MTTETKNRIGKWGFVIFFFLLGGYVAWAYWPGKKPVHNDEFGPPRRREQANGANSGPTDAQRAEWEKRMQERQAQMDAQMLAWLQAKSAADRNAALDAAIDAMLERQKEWQARRAAEAADGGGAATRPGGPGGGRGDRGPPSLAEVRQHIANRVDNSDPQKSALRQAYRQAMQQRMTQRGITPPSGGGGGFGMFGGPR